MLSLELPIALGITAGMMGLLLLIILGIIAAYDRGLDAGWDEAMTVAEDRQPQERG